MKRDMLRWLFAVLALAGMDAVVRAQLALQPKPACPPGCKVVEEVIIKEQVRHCCKVVPNVKKKWVYDWVEEGFCIPKSPFCPPGCDKHKIPHCKSCTRKQLVKKEVEECAGYKCEVDKIVEKVPCKVYRIVPCGPAEAAFPAPTTLGRVDVPPSENPFPPALSTADERPRLLPYFMLDRRRSPVSAKSADRAR